MQPKRRRLAGLRGHHDAGKTHHAADRERHAERFVAAAGLADRRAGDENQKHRQERHHGHAAERQQPGDADGGQSAELEVIADEQPQRNVRPLIETMDGETTILKAVMVQAGMK